MEIETQETRAKLAEGIRILQAKGDTNTINQLVNAYKSKYTKQPEQPDYSIIKPQIQNPIQQAGNIVGAFGSSLKENLQGLGELYGGGEQGIASKLGKDIQEASADIQKGNIAKGVAKAGFRTAGDVAGTIFAPIGAGIGTITGGINKLFPSLGKKYDEGINYVADKISDIPAVQKFAVEHPNAGEDFNRALNLIISKYEKTPITKEGLADATLKISKILTQENQPLKIPTKAEAIQPFQEAKQNILNIPEKIKSIPNKITPKSITPSNIMQRVFRVNPSDQIKFQKMAGENIGEYATKRGIFDKEALLNRFENSKAEADNALASLDGKFNPTPVNTMLKELYKREISVSLPGALSKDFPRVRELVNINQKNGLNMSEINEVKRIYERNVKLDYVRQNLSDKIARANTLDSAVRKWQDTQAEKSGLLNLPQIKKEIQLSKQLINSLDKKEFGMDANNNISITDWIMLSGASPTSIAGFGVKRLFSNKGVQAGIAKLFSPKPIGETKAIFGKPKTGYNEFIESTEGLAKPPTLPPVEKGLKIPTLSKVNQIKPISPLAQKIISPRSGTLADKILNPESRVASNIPQNTSNVNTLSTTPKSWNEFVKGKMSPYMKSEGGHAGAMKRLSAEWNQYKNQTAKTSAPFTTSMSKTSSTGASKLSGNEAIKSQLSENALIKEAKKYKSAEEFVNSQIKKAGIATRYGEINKDGAYFSTSIDGVTNKSYFNANTSKGVVNEPYDISSVKIVKSNTPEALQILKEAAKDTSNTPQQLNLLKREINNPDNTKTAIIDWHMNDNIPSIVNAAKKFGYDGIQVIETGDVSKPTSVFIWNTKKVVPVKSQLTEIWKKANK